MSQATASAKARRAFNSNNSTPATSSASPINVNAQGLTLPQVISIIDSRLVNLENYVKEEKSTPRASLQSVPTQNSELLNEFNHRTTLLAEELASLKDIVLKLQSYTMEVNKTLYEERIHVLSDLGDIQQNGADTEDLIEVSENSNE
jgi:hypothetical protein